MLSSGYYDAYYLKALRTKALIKKAFDAAFFIHMMQAFILRRPVSIFYPDVYKRQLLNGDGDGKAGIHMLQDYIHDFSSRMARLDPLTQKENDDDSTRPD